MKERSQNGCINMFRIIFTMLIAFLHFESAMYNVDTRRVYEGGYLAVDFFFVLSGFFLAHSFNIKQEQACEYILYRIKKLYPLYFIGCILTIVYSVGGLLKVGNTNGMLRFLISEIPELLCVQMTGITHQWVNFPLWYVSALLIVSAPLYKILSLTYSRKENIICFSIIAFVSYILLFLNRGDLGLDININYIFYIYSGIYRALAGMSLGIVTYLINDAIRDKLRKFNLRTPNVLDILFVGIIFLMLINVFITPHSSYDYFFPIIVSFLLILCNQKLTICGIISKIDEKILSKIYTAGVPYAMYVMQKFTQNIFVKMWTAWGGEKHNIYISWIYHSVNNCRYYNMLFI